jgi:catechol 2,3-dioxygenase-like lactoylglutathione lyase family enzyme
MQENRETPQGRIKSISELALWVDDVEQATAFYRDLLGFQVEDFDAGRNAFLRSGDFLLVLFNPADPGTALANEYLARTGGPRGGVYHAAFRVEPGQLDAFATDLKEKGIAVKGPVEFATGRRSYFFEDPDAHYIELTDC